MTEIERLDKEIDFLHEQIDELQSKVYAQSEIISMLSRIVAQTVPDTIPEWLKLQELLGKLPKID